METPNVFSSKNICLMLVVFVVILSAFLLAPWHEAKAADASEYVYFRIDTELDVLEAKTALTVDWSCNGVASGSITDNTASESAQALDGIVKVASASAEWTESTCSTKNGGTIRAKAYVDGWVTRRWTAVFLASTSYTAPFTTTASLDYNLVIGPVKDELNNDITLNTGTASASYTAASIASSSYSGTKRYVAANGDGTITVGNGGYVDKTQAVTWSSDYQTASKSATFDGTSGTYNVGKLQYAAKITYNTTDWRSATISNRAGATVVAGASSTACTDSSGVYYCPVPVVAHASGTTATATLATFTTSNTCTLTDRTLNSSDQSTCTITAVQAASVTQGGAGAGIIQLPAEATPTPTPTVPAGATPTPTVVAEATPTPTPASAAGAVKLFKKANDPKVYVQKSDGTLGWVKTLTDFNAAGYKWMDVKVISGSEFGKMRVGGNVRIVKGISYLRVRAGSSTAEKVVGKVLPGQELKFTEIKNGWYHIDSGWVSGAYAKEF